MVMDTAASPAETAIEEQAPPQETAPETAITASVPETPPEPAPETAPSVPETPDYASILSSLKAEDLRELAPVKDLLARENESIRRRTENDTAKTMARQRQEWLAKGEYATDLEGLLKNSVHSDDLGETRVALDRKGVESFVDKVWDASVLGTINATLKVIESQLPDGVKIAPDDLRNLQDLYAESMKNPAKSQDLLSAELSLLKKEWLNAAKPALRKEIEAEIKKDAEARAKSETIKQADDAQRETPSPTRISGSGGAPTSFDSLTAATAAYHDGEITHDQFKAERKRFGVKD
jgi:hypothetical protein